MVGILQGGKLDSLIDALSNLEKQMRLTTDVSGTRKVVVGIVHICYEVHAWKTLSEKISVLSKKRGQLKHVYNPCFLFGNIVV